MKPQIPRQALIVLGMHRSGTSALTRVLNLLGTALPADLMPPNEDNRPGYWESRQIARFNNRLLESAGHRWDSDAPLSVEWLCDEVARASHYEEARALLAGEFGDAPLFVFKDPRLCRLFPFWEKVLAGEGIDMRVVLCLRDPREVAASLAARFDNPSLHPAAIPAYSRTYLLWLRHVLEAERSTRHLPRIAVDYADLVSDWRTALQDLPSLCPGLTLPSHADPKSQEMDFFLDPNLRRQSSERASKKSADFFASVTDAVKFSVSLDPHRNWLDEIAADLGRLVTGYAPLRAKLERLCPRDVWAERIVQELETLHPSPISIKSLPVGIPRVLFVSRTPESRAHTYRVLHPLEGLSKSGWDVKWLAATDPALTASIGQADVVVVSRGPWDEKFCEIRAACSTRGVPLVCDVDDLTFEPGVMEAGYFAYLAELGSDARESFLREAAEFRSALSSCDAVIATTKTLANAASRHSPRAFVLPNCFSRGMLASAETWRTVPKPSSVDGCLRVGFASGTPTHTRDFATIAEAIADFLADNPNARFVLVGYLNLARFPCLLLHKDRIECRPAVPLANLYAELARFDINLAPLEVGNPFCEAKSEIRYTAAAALGIPTIASATAPMRQTIIDRETGLLAAEAGEWRGLLQQLSDDPALRAKLGEAARIDTRMCFGPEKTGRLAKFSLSAVFGGIESARRILEPQLSKQTLGSR
jgi:glycosyltransferase involved in cell wall biosynthesis